MDIYPAISGEVFHTLFCAACLSFFWGVSEAAGHFHDRHNTYEAVCNPWALCLYVFYAALAVLAGLILIETGAMRPGWLTIFLLGLGAPAILRTNFNPLQTDGGPDDSHAGRVDRLVDNIRRFVFGEIDRSLAERRNERREKVLSLYTVDELEQQLELRLPGVKAEYAGHIEETRNSPAQLAALFLMILDHKQPNAIDELAAAARNKRRDGNSGSIRAGH